MSVLFDIAHPQTYHMFNQTIKKLCDEGIDTSIIIRHKDVLDKLIIYDNRIKYHIIDPTKVHSRFRYFYFFLLYFKIIFKTKSKIIVNNGSILSSLVALFLRRNLLVFDNTDSDFFIPYIRIWANRIVTPNCYYRDFGKNHFKFHGINESTYLPYINESLAKVVRGKIGVVKNERFCILRFVSWRSHDDYSGKIIGNNDKYNLFIELRKNLKVFISSEDTLPVNMADYHLEKKFKIYGKEMHVLLRDASLLIGDSGAMAVEAVLQGTHSIFISNKKLSTIDFVEKKTNMLYRSLNIEDAINNAKRILEKNFITNYETINKFVENNINVNRMIYRLILDQLRVLG